MKRTIIFGIIVSLVVLLLLPSIPAVSYSTVVDTNKAQIIKEIRGMSRDELREKIMSVDWSSVKEVQLGRNLIGFIINLFVTLKDTLPYLILTLMSPFLILFQNIASWGLVFGPIVTIGVLFIVFLQVIGILPPDMGVFPG
jgi:hypothetical protein